MKSPSTSQNPRSSNHVRSSSRKIRRSGSNAAEVVMYEPSEGPGMRAANWLRAAVRAAAVSDCGPA